MTAMTTVVRRTQAERRASSRGRLLDATVQCLAELGYAGTSLPEIVRRAGLSNGALWRHFQTKSELLAAAAVAAEEQLLAGSRDPVPVAASSGDRLDEVIDHMLAWSADPAMHAIVELLLASRTDAELNQAVRPQDERMGLLFVNEIERILGPDLSSHPLARSNVRQLGLLLYGITVTQHLRPVAATDQLAAELRLVARKLFDC